MIITIDTSKDSPEMMRKAARLLEQLAGGTTDTQTAPVEVSAEMFEMFSSDTSAPSTDDTPAPPSPPDRVVPY